jgi:dihydrofolate synthase/folylpolyglutamate synthase
MDLLGNTLEKIAFEKAGIIKKNVPVVISETQPSLKELFVSKANETGSVISFADERFSCRFYENDSVKEERRYTVTDLITNRIFEGYTVLGGDYQSVNLKAIFCIILNLQPLFRFSDRNISDGIRKVVLNTGLAGRWQILNREPLTICDTAHNKEGLEYVMRQIKSIQRSGLHMIIGFVNDKDLNMILPLFPKGAAYYFTRASVQRALDEGTLKAKAERFGLIGNCYKDVRSALSDARINAEKSDMIFIGGSTFIVAEVI